MNFNPYAFVKPNNKEEFIALLEEAERMAEDLLEMWEQAFTTNKGEGE